MKGYSKKIIAGSAVLAIGLVALLAVRKPIVHYASNVATFVKEYSNAHDDMLQVLREEIFSTPLRANLAGDRSTLSPSEIIRITNEKRNVAHVAPLARNVLLDQAATRKLQDMFDRQYFDHVSPDGKGPGYIAEKAGYSYVVIGENLAMGTFETDEALMNAWMASEGHKENILNDRYTEIGVAVGHGTFNGERIWLAVQEFGKPSSECPAIQASLRSSIDKDKAAVAELETTISSMKKTIDTMTHDTPEESAAYNAKVSDYNDTVSRYNDKIASLKKEIDEYNTEVHNFNSCAEE